MLTALEEMVSLRQRIVVNGWRVQDKQPDSLIW